MPKPSNPHPKKARFLMPCRDSAHRGDGLDITCCIEGWLQSRGLVRVMPPMARQMMRVTPANSFLYCHPNL